ncbi:putative nitrogen fixation protein NifT [Gloeothece verrucosa]|uniref:Nitrogen fixation protein FixT n=1 Tax=Gloeothece verrucosa (strain PCC 7822) TaxID=497965 RepID=E0UH04_GLOV7|nr:putative nitrogen fixation protein NifT [Gloeothece verrucosa]ADN15603.1 nitrogen fixation protein FixT [Gloeothece verrucosa PCC 7822]
MKVILSRTSDGNLSVYVPKKDLEEVVVSNTDVPDGTVLTLANGWELAFSRLANDIQLPQTLEAKKL